MRGMSGGQLEMSEGCKAPGRVGFEPRRCVGFEPRRYSTTGVPVEHDPALSHVPVEFRDVAALCGKGRPAR